MAEGDAPHHAEIHVEISHHTSRSNMDRVDKQRYIVVQHMLNAYDA